MRAVHRGAACLIVVFLSSNEAAAWVYPEHREITLAALRQLDPDRRRALDGLWAAARGDHDLRLCAAADSEKQGQRPDCIDYAAWPAIAGDHSCSSQQMTETVLRSDWIVDVAAVAARLEQRLARAQGRRAAVSNAVRDSDIRLQRADLEYATRAKANNAHFLLARPSSISTPLDYATKALEEGAELNALAVYAWYHLAALDQARALSAPVLPPQQRAAFSLAALADEAFALHFLEDAFAAGHVAGTWGSAALRKGTHDYYNERGIEVTTWRGERIILTGDAWMRPEDEQRTARAVSKSLAQLIDAARGMHLDSFHSASTPAPAPASFDVCRATQVPRDDHDARDLLLDVLMDSPFPALTSGLGEMPRFRAELGPFAGVQAAARGSTSTGGFGESQDSAGASAGLELSFRVGLGLEGVLNDAGDGLIFLDLGVRQDSRSSNSFSTAPAIPQAGATTAAIPERFAYVLRLRMPFWLVPLDLLIASPVLLLASPSTLSSMAVVAANGGLVPWQEGVATPIGRFQFILGREVALGIFGYGHHGDRMIIPNQVGPELHSTLVDVSSIQIELPALEYRPFRTFSRDQSTTLVFQLYGAFDIPSRHSVVAPAGDPNPHLTPFASFGVRMSFDWRYYL